MNGNEYCPIWNDTPRSITLKYGTAIATVSTIQDKLKSYSLEESIQAYRDAENRHNTREINNIDSRNNRRHFYRNNQRRSYANKRRHAYAYSPDHLYTDNARHNPRRLYTHDTRPFYATTVPCHNRESNAEQNFLVHSVAKIPNIPHNTSIPHTTDIPDTIVKQHTTHYNTTNHENKTAPAAITNIPQIDKHTKPSGIPHDQHTTTTKCPHTPQKIHHNTNTPNNNHMTLTPADETHKTKPQEHEPQPTIAGDSQNQNSMNDDKSSEHTIVDESTDGAALHIIQQKTVRRPKTCRIALQKLEQDT